MLTSVKQRGGQGYLLCQSVHLCCSSLQLRLFARAYRSRKHCLSGSCGGMSTWVWLVSSGCPSVAASSSSWYLNCGSRALVVDDDEFSGAPGRSSYLRQAWDQGRKSLWESLCQCYCWFVMVKLSWNTERLAEFTEWWLSTRRFGLRKPILLLETKGIDPLTV